MKLRFLPADVFAVIQTFAILSLIYAPMPFGWGNPGMTHTTTLISTVSGVTLAFLLLTSALGVGMKFSTYRKVSMAAGLVLALAAIARLDFSPGTMALVICQGFALFASALTVETGKRVTREAEVERETRIPQKIDTLDDYREAA